MQPNSADHNYSLACTSHFGSILKDGKIHEVAITYFDKVIRVYFDSMEKPVLKATINLIEQLALKDGECFMVESISLYISLI